jgi:uncharacterized protein
MNPAELSRLLHDTQTIAVLGASADPERPSNEVYRYLVSTGAYTVYPVNPTVTEIDGAPSYPNLAALPVVPDLVDVFRRRDQLATVLAEVLALPQRPKTLWLQLGLRDDEIAQSAEEAGITVVMDRCVKVEHARHA